MRVFTIRNHILLIGFVLVTNISYAAHIDELEGFTGPAEFSEEEVKKEAEANYLASIGTKKMNGLEITWSPETTLLKGRPDLIQKEFENLKLFLNRSKTFKKLVEKLKYKVGSNLLDLSPLIDELKNMRIKNRKITNCYSMPLWYYGKTGDLDSTQLLDFTQKKMQKVNSRDALMGDVALIRDSGRSNEEVHSYLYISENLGLEIRGSGFIFFRPPEAIDDEWKSILKLTPRSNRSLGRFSASYYRIR